MPRAASPSRMYPLRRFEEWLVTDRKVNKTTVPTYTSTVRQALVAVGGDYADGTKLGEYLASLPPGRYRNTVTAWRHFTSFLAEQGKYAYELTPAERGHTDPGGEDGLDASVRALRDVFVWMMTGGRRFGANRLIHARFVERRGAAWVVQFLEDEPPTVCDPKISRALNLLYERAGRPADPRGCLVWPEEPGGDTEATGAQFKKLLGRRLLLDMGGISPLQLVDVPAQPPTERIVIDPLPGMDGKWD